MSTEINVLMAAAQSGDSNAVNSFIKSGINVNEKVNETTAVDLAWNNQHFEIVLDLLKANSQFPINFDIENLIDGIKEFVGTMEFMHKMILKENILEISNILENNPNLRHFYSTKNISAPAFALMNRKFRVYEFLIASNVYIGSYENIDEIFKELSKTKCKDLKKIHLKYMKNFNESHLITLSMNSRVSGEPENTQEKLELVKSAYKFLDQVDPFISLILQVVAASSDFRIFFDFESSSIQDIKVIIDQENERIRKINIPASDLLDSSKVSDFYQFLVCELCIYAMELIYKNYGRPYSSTDEQTKIIFNRISRVCEENREVEELVHSLYDNKDDMHHAKLVALVPQMIVKYSNDLAKMDECINKFSSLFEFCQNVIELEMKHKLPTIKSSAEQKAQKFQTLNKKQTKMLIALVLAIPFAIWLTFLLAKPYIEPIYSCGNLTDELRSKIFESTVEFQGVNVIFGDLFGRNSEACKHLSPQEVTSMIRVFDSGKFAVSNNTIYINFAAEENAAIDRRSKRSNNEGKRFKEIKEQNQAVDGNMTANSDYNVYSKYMKRKFLKSTLKIDKAVDLRSKFYIERWALYPRYENFPNVYYITGFHELSEVKFLLISDKGGSGKSTYFRHMTWKLKRQFPLKWISYVDLKQYIHVLQDVPKIDVNLKTVVDFLSSKLLNLTSKVEVEVFKNKFVANESIFLWDGIDEVSPRYTNETVRLIEIVKILTNNSQWLSTRPHLKDMLVKKFDIILHKLDEFIAEDKMNFVEKYLETNGIENQNMTNVMSEIDGFIKNHRARTFQTSGYFGVNETNPQMLFILCEAYAKNKQLNSKINLYTIFDSFFTKSFEDVVLNKGNIVQKDTLKVTELGLFRKYHQHYSVARDVFRSFMSIINGSSILMYQHSDVCKVLNKIKEEEVMRFGILYKINNVMMYEQRIFRDFFIAQYLYTEIWENPLSSSPRDNEADFRLNFLFFVLHRCQTKYKVVCDFINGFVDAYSTSSSFDPIIKHMMMTNYSDLMYYMDDDSSVIETTTKFFKKDRDIIKFLWKINENRTYFHEYFDKITSASDVGIMTKIVRENFNDIDAEKIINGRYQAANFLRMAWQKRQTKNNTIAFVKGVNFRCNVDVLVKIKTFEGFMNYFEEQNYSREELLEFFKVSIKQRAIKTQNDKKLFIRYAKKLLSAQDFLDMTNVWGMSLIDV